MNVENGAALFFFGEGSGPSGFDDGCGEGEQHQHEEMSEELHFFFFFAKGLDKLLLLCGVVDERRMYCQMTERLGCDEMDRERFFEMGFDDGR